MKNFGDFDALPLYWSNSLNVKVKKDCVSQYFSRWLNDLTPRPGEILESNRVNHLSANGHRGLHSHRVAGCHCDHCHFDRSALSRFRAVQNQAKHTQAKNDLTQIVNAVNAFYTDYGKYPLATSHDTPYVPGGNSNSNVIYFRLRAMQLNARSC